MNSSALIRVIFITVLILIFQIFIPEININGLEINPDLIIILIAYFGYYYGRLVAIIIGFLLGLIQDFITQYELIGIMAFSKSIIGYILGTMELYHSIWHRNFRLFFIFITYLLHFFIYYFFRFNGTTISAVLFFKIILLQTILCFLILFLFDRAIMKNGITR